MPYRIEIASQGRAGCKSKECKDAAVKIAKGELRFGTLITIQDHTSWTWKHWGCVTPVQIANLQDESGGDTEMVDGFDELDEDSQQKVRYALKNGHVPDEDWKGDVEVNRPGQKGFRVKIATPKKKKAKAATPDDVDDEDKPKKKRGRPAKAADDEAAPAAKKPRAKKAKKVKDEDEDTEPEVIPTKKARGKVVKKEEEDVEVEPAAKKPKVKGKKATTKKEPHEEADGVDDEEEAPEPVKVKRGKKVTAATADGDEKPKRGRKKKAPVDEE